MAYLRANALKGRRFKSLAEENLFLVIGKAVSLTSAYDMGLKILPSKSGEILLELIMRRYENRSP